MTAPKRQNITLEAKGLIKRIYTHHSAGCCWHVVLDDGNWDCIEYAKKSARQSSVPNDEYECETHGACQELAALDVTARILARAREAAFRELRTA